MVGGHSPGSVNRHRQASYLSKNITSAALGQPMFRQTHGNGPSPSPQDGAFQLSPSARSSDRILGGDDESFARPGEISGLGVIEDLNELQDMRITDVNLNPFAQRKVSGHYEHEVAQLGASLQASTTYNHRDYEGAVTSVANDRVVSGSESKDANEASYYDRIFRMTDQLKNQNLLKDHAISASALARKI